MNDVKVWGIHNTNDEQLLLKNNVAAIGWAEMGDLSRINQDRESYYDLYGKVYPGKTKQSIANSAGQLFRFVNEAKIGDYIIYPTKYNRRVFIGIIEGNYTFEANEPEYNQQRKVKWLKDSPRTIFL